MATRSRADGYGVLRESESGVRYGELQMSRWIYNTATSFDGYIADGENSLDWLFAVEREGAEDTSIFLSGIGVLVEGSTTYKWVLEAEDLLGQPHKWQEFYGERPTFVFTTRERPIRTARGWSMPACARTS